MRGGVERPPLLADEGVAGVGARGDGGEGEARIEGGGQVFEGVDGEIDAAGGEGVFDLLDEDALGVERGAVGEGGGNDEGGVLHAVAGGADDVDGDGVAVGAEDVGDVVGLPERELGASGADADGGHVECKDNAGGGGNYPHLRFEMWGTQLQFALCGYFF